MPENKPKSKLTEDQIKERFIQSLQIGIPGPESKGDYSAQNKEGTAAGKYQFTSFWLDEAGSKSIKSFAKQSGVFDVPEDMDDFKNNPELQDAYFRYYAKDVLYPQAKKAYQGKNPAGLTLEEMGAIFHFKPPLDDKIGNTGAYKQIRTGEFDEATVKGKNGAEYSNASTLRYLKKVNEAWESSGVDKLSTKELIDTGVEKKVDKEAVVKEYREKFKNISKLDIPDNKKEKLRNDLMRKSVKDGNWEIINEGIQEDLDKFSSGKKLFEVFNQANIKYTAVKGKDPRIKNIESKALSKEEGERILEDFPELKKHADLVSIGGEYHLNVSDKFGKDVKAFDKTFNKIFDTWTGEDVDAKIYLEDDGKNDAWFKKHQDKTGKYLTGSANFNDLKPGISTLIDPKELPGVESGPKRSEQWEGKMSGADLKNDIKVGEIETEFIDSEAKEKEEDEEYSESDAFFGRELGLLDANGQDMSYDASQMKRELPMDAVTGMALGLIGNDQAKDANIPLRTEEVSEAVKNYTAELSKRSKDGLPVEVEAAMKNQLAEVYQGGLKTLTNNSAGNRALILGNQGQLETSRVKGLVDMQLADYEAKDKAFQQYGQAIKYMNDFDSRRDIANHGIKLQQGLMDQQEGKALATSGFKMLADGIRDQRENGPGSANHMYKSALMQRIFGFNPLMKDDGTGTQEGSQSKYMKERAQKEEQLGITKMYQDKLGSMSPEHKKAADRFLTTNQNKSQAYKFIDYLSENPDVDPTAITMDNMDLATKKDNYGLLSVNREEALTPTVKTESALSKPNGLLSSNNDISAPLMQGPQEVIPEEDPFAMPELGNMDQAIGLINNESYKNL